MTIGGLATGNSVVNCEKDDYLAKPEKMTTNIVVGGNKVHMTLLLATQTAAYYQRAGRQIEAEASPLSTKMQEAFYLREWERIKLLPFEFQIPIVGEFKHGKTYLASEPQYQTLLKSGKITGNH